MKKKKGKNRHGIARGRTGNLDFIPYSPFTLKKKKVTVLFFGC